MPNNGGAKGKEVGGISTTIQSASGCWKA